MAADVEALGNRCGGQHGADRETAAETLCGGQNIRRDAIAHVSVEMTRAAVPGLHFVEHQQCLVAVAQFAHPLQEFRSGADDAAFTQYRFDDHRAGTFGNHLGESSQIVERNMSDARRQRSKAFGVLGLAADGDGE